MATKEEPLTITVFSYRGGTGKSTLAANMGILFSKMGLKTILVDLDLYSPQLLYMFDLAPKTYLNDYYSNRLPELKAKRGRSADLNEIIIQSSFSNLDLILSDPELSLQEDLILHSTNIEHDLFPFMLDFSAKLKTSYDIIIFDTPAQLNYYSLHAIILADLVIGSITPTKANIEGIKRIVKILRGRIMSKRFDLFVSMVTPRYTIDREKMLDKLKSNFIELGIERCIFLDYSIEISYRDQVFNDLFFKEKDPEYSILMEYITNILGRYEIE